jgi:hypothetical protein
MSTPFARAPTRAATSSLQDEFGADGRTGAIGEKLYLKRLNTLASTVSDFYGSQHEYEVTHSLNIPRGMKDRQPLRGDVDFAVASGRHLVLVDSKLWKDGLYWSLPMPPRSSIALIGELGRSPLGQAASSRFLGRTLGMRGLSPHQPGKWFLSQNMPMAVERYSERLIEHGIKVSGLVAFLDSSGSGTMHVGLLRWSKGISSYSTASSFEQIAKRLGPPEPVAEPIRSLIHKMKRR